MKTKRKLGVWMDHSIAHLMEISHEPFEVTTIESDFQKQPVKKASMTYTKTNQLQLKYYRKISQAIKDFYYVVLFGPSDAKLELFDLLAEDESFLKMKIEIKETDEMNPRQKHEFVMKYFATL